MSRLVIWEAGYLLTCFLLGIVLMIVYDSLRIIRIVLPHHFFWMGLEDILYWLMASFAIFSVLYRENDGRIRWYAIAVITISMLIFNFCISRFLTPWIGRLLRLPIDFIGKLLKRIRKAVKIKFKKLEGKRWFHGRNKVEKEKKQ